VRLEVLHKIDCRWIEQIPQVKSGQLGRGQRHRGAVKTSQKLLCIGSIVTDACAQKRTDGFLGWWLPGRPRSCPDALHDASLHLGLVPLRRAGTVRTEPRKVVESNNGLVGPVDNATFP
jgi:hypothetical protein